MHWRDIDLNKWEKLNRGFLSADFREAKYEKCQILLLGYSEEMKNIRADREHWPVYEADEDKTIGKDK